MVDYFGYKVCEDGRIFKENKELIPSDNGRGYLIVFITLGERRTSKAIHRILAECYIPNPERRSDVDHIDGDKRNNSLSNLRWISHGENIKHSYKLGNRSATGVNNSRALLTEAEVNDICYLLQLGYRSNCIRDMGYPYTTTRRIKTRRAWNSISKYYSF